MAFIDDFKAKVPWAMSMDNDALIDYLAKSTNQPRDVVAEDFGVYNPKRGRTIPAVVNDTVIEGANAALGGVKSAADFVVPGNRFSHSVDELIKEGEASQSYQTQRRKRGLSEVLSTSDEVMPQLKAVGKYVVENPGLAAAQAAGSFAGPGLAVKGAQKGALALKMGEQAAERSGLGAGMIAGGAMSGGDAAGNAYELIMKSPHLAGLSEQERELMAQAAARDASILPAIYGFATGAFGAERALARGTSKGILRTGLSEAAQEFGDEGLSAYSGRAAAAEYDPNINPMTGVVGQATLGGVLGGVTGGALGAMTRPRGIQVPDLDNKAVTTDLLNDPSAGETAGPTQLPLFQESDLPEPYVGPRRPPPPGYTPDMLDPDPSIQTVPPLEYTASTADPEFLAAQQAQAARIAKKQGKAVPTAPGSAAIPIAPAPPLLGELRQAYLSSGVLTQEQQALLAADASTLSPSQKSARSQLSGRVGQLVSWTANGIDSKEAAIDKLDVEIEKLSKGKKQDRGRAETLLQWVNTLRGTPPEQQRTLDQYIEGKNAPIQGSLATAGGNAAAAPIVGRRVVKAPVPPAIAVRPELVLTGEAPVSRKLRKEVYPGAEEINADFAKAQPELPGLNTEPVVSRRKKVVKGVKAQTQFVEQGEKVSREAPEIAPDVVADAAPTLQEEQEVDPDVESIQDVVEDEGGERGEIATADDLQYDTQEKGLSFQAGAAMSVREDRKGERGGNDTSDSPKAVAYARRNVEANLGNLGAKKAGEGSREGGHVVADDELHKVVLDELSRGEERNRATVERIAAEVKRREEVLFETLRKRKSDIGLAREEPAEKRTELRVPVPERPRAGEENPDQTPKGETDEVRDEDGEGRDNEAAEIPEPAQRAKAAKPAEAAAQVQEVTPEFKRQALEMFGAALGLNPPPKRMELPEDADTRAARIEARKKEIELEDAAAVAAEAREKPTREKKSAPKKEKQVAKPAAPVSVDPADAEKAWAKLKQAAPVLPAWSELKPGLQKEFTDYGSNNWKLADAVNMIERKGTKAQRSEAVKNTTMSADAAELHKIEIEEEIFGFIRGLNTNKLEVVAIPADIPEDVREAVEETGPIGSSTQGFVYDGKAWLIASNIKPGRARAVFMHEVGSHLGLENLLTKAQFNQLADKVLEWAKREDSSRESKLAAKAAARALGADPKGSFSRNELVAYFVEEAVLAGIDPMANAYSEMGRWFRTLWAAFKAGLRRLGFDRADFNAQDVVNMAFGAAQLSMDGSYHGSGKNFRKFNLSYRGTGEGGLRKGNDDFTDLVAWGVYTAQNKGIADGYRRRLSGQMEHEDLYKFYDTKHRQDVMLQRRDPHKNSYMPGGLEYQVRMDGVDPPTRTAAKSMAHHGGVDGAITAAKEVLAQTDLTEEQRDYYDEVLYELKEFKAEGIRVVPYKTPDDMQGVLYHVSVNAKPDDMIQWEKPWAEQSKKVRTAILRLMEGNENLTERQAEEMAERKPMKLTFPNGMYAYKRLADELGSQKKASQALARLGVKGVQFLDSNSRSVMYGQAPSYNFVIFDPKDVVIASKNPDIPKSKQVQRSFVGEKARGTTDSTVDLVAAKLMASNGETTETIWRVTGWFKGPDNKWRREIPDTGARIIKRPEMGKPLPLGKVLAHPMLYRAHPHLMGVSVAVTSDGDTYYSPRSDSIGIGAGYVWHSDKGEFRRSLLHEVQHAIQRREGFAEGASYEYPHLREPNMLSKMRHILESSAAERRLAEAGLTKADIHAAVQVVADYQKLMKREAEAHKRVVDLYRESEPDAEWDARMDDANAAIDAASHAVKAYVTPNVVEVLERLNYAAYLLHTGELEARDGEYRAQYPDSASFLPAISAIPRGEQFTVRKGGLADKHDAPKVQRSVASTLDKLPAGGQSAVNTVLYNGHKAILSAAFTQDLADMAVKHLPTVKKFMSTLNARMVDRMKMEEKVDKIYSTYDRLSDTVKTAVDNFIHDSTRQGKWGYNLRDDGKDHTDPAMKARFEALPTVGQELVRAVFKHGYEALKTKQQAVLDETASEYDMLIAVAKATGDTAQIAKLKKQKAHSLKNFQTMLRIDNSKPYAPLTQFGDYVVVGRSAELVEAEKMGDDELVETLKGNANHYYVHFTTSKGQAMADEARLKAEHPTLVTDNFEKDDEARFKVFGGKGVLDAITRLRGRLRDEGGPEAAKAEGLLREMYLRTMAENSARKSELSRLGVEGTSREMLRAFVKQGRADAHFVSTIKHNADLTTHLIEMKKEAEEKSEGRVYYNELQRRYARSLEYSPTPVQDTITRLTSFWFLATSPSYYLQNATQPFLMSLPVMASKYGYFRSWRALAAAYKDLGPIIKTAGVFAPLDLGKLPADVRSQVEELLQRGRIQIGLEQEMGRIVEGSMMTAEMRNVDRKLRGLTQKVETINRVATAIAALRLGGDVESTSKLIYDTHGDYSGMNTPGFYSRVPAARVVLQFKKFQMIQFAMLARLVSGAFKGASLEERQIARKALAFTLGHAAVIGGATGMPFYTAIAWMLGEAFGDDEEPDNPELAMRRMIGDPVLADLLVAGTPAALGMNVSQRVGMGNMLNPFGVSDVSFKDQASRAEALVAMLGGPATSLGMRATEGIFAIGRGDLYKGSELLMPKGLADVMKAYRFASEGITNKKGETLVSPEDLSVGAEFGQAFGLPTTDITERTWRSNTLFKTNEFYNNKTAELKQRYAKAAKAGDADTLEEVREAWGKLQEARVKNGLPRQGVSELLKARAEMLKHEREKVGGVITPKATRKLAQELEQR